MVVKIKPLKTEHYRGYPIKFVEKIMGNGKKLVIAEYASKITRKLVGHVADNKNDAYNFAKKNIDRELQYLKQWGGLKMSLIDLF